MEDILAAAGTLEAGNLLAADTLVAGTLEVDTPVAAGSLEEGRHRAPKDRPQVDIHHLPVGNPSDDGLSLKETLYHETLHAHYTYLCPFLLPFFT